MDLIATPFDPENRDHLKLLCESENDPEIRGLTIPNRKGMEVPLVTEESLLKRAQENTEKTENNFLIEADGKLIGSFSIMLNPPHRIVKEGLTSWLGLTISDKSYWGKGVGTWAMKQMEVKSIELGADRIEVGVFAYNQKSYKLCKKLNYKEIKRIPKFTYWNDQWWDDIRMEKSLSLKSE